jgi:hypothetical protein
VEVYVYVYVCGMETLAYLCRAESGGNRVCVNVDCGNSNTDSTSGISPPPPPPEGLAGALRICESTLYVHACMYMYEYARVYEYVHVYVYVYEYVHMYEYVQVYVYVYVHV